jgi:phenylalanyl-tRNA synthetase alpha chain
MNPSEMIGRLAELAAACETALAGLGDERAVRELQAAYLGKKGEVTQLQRLLGGIPPEARKEVGRAFNDTKNRITSAVTAAIAELSSREDRGTST